MVNRPVVTVVGLGPGDPALASAATLQAIAAHDVRFVRTARHPSAALAGDAVALDHHYESGESFDDTYQGLIDEVVTAALDHGRVLYAVPGSPNVAERTVRLLQADSRVEVVVLPALSFLDLAWSRLTVDPAVDMITVVDAWDAPPLIQRGQAPLLIACTWNRELLSDIKLSIDWDPAVEPTATFCVHLGLDDERIVEVPWSQLDQAIEPDHLTCVYVPAFDTPGRSVGAAMTRFDEVSRRLRADCPWDAEQTHTSLLRYLAEEAHEVADAIAAVGDGVDELPRDPREAALVIDADEHFCEELGDLLYQVVFHARLAEERGAFDLTDVIESIESKLIRRHPHVFEGAPNDLDSINATWATIKAAEKQARAARIEANVTRLTRR
jgi:tetrapyrrole methylase family protein / MazG family protein